MAIMPQSQWELEGELLQLHMDRDRLAKKGSLTEDEQERIRDMEKRIAILQECLRKERMRA